MHRDSYDLLIPSQTKYVLFSEPHRPPRVSRLLSALRSMRSRLHCAISTRMRKNGVTVLSDYLSVVDEVERTLNSSTNANRVFAKFEIKQPRKIGERFEFLPGDECLRPVEAVVMLSRRDRTMVAVHSASARVWCREMRRRIGRELVRQRRG